MSAQSSVINKFSEAEATNLITAGESHIVYCSGFVPDVTSVLIDGWTTDTTRTLTIQGSEDPSYCGGRHTGVEGTGYVLHPSHTVYGISVDSDNVTVED